ncbi:hypothetical protein VIGAN_06120800, partial [Vigna angularis var. angularis]
SIHFFQSRHSPVSFLPVPHKRSTASPFHFFQSHTALLQLFFLVPSSNPAQHFFSHPRAQTHLHIWKPYTSRRLDDAHTHRSLNAVDDTPPRRLLVAAEECELPVIYLNRLEDSDETVKEEYKPHIARASQEWGFFQVVSLKYVSSLTTHRSRVSITQQLPTESERSISCDCSFEESHVVKMTLKRLSIPGTLPPQLAKLPFLQEVDFAYNFFIGSIPEGASMKLALISIDTMNETVWHCFC